MFLSVFLFLVLSLLPSSVSSIVFDTYEGDDQVQLACHSIELEGSSFEHCFAIHPSHLVLRISRCSPEFDCLTHVESLVSTFDDSSYSLTKLTDLKEDDTTVTHHFILLPPFPDPVASPDDVLTYLSAIFTPKITLLSTEPSLVSVPLAPPPSSSETPGANEEPIDYEVKIERRIRRGLKALDRQDFTNAVRHFKRAHSFDTSLGRPVFYLAYSKIMEKVTRPRRRGVDFKMTKGVKKLLKRMIAGRKRHEKKVIAEGITTHDISMMYMLSGSLYVAMGVSYKSKAMASFDKSSEYANESEDEAKLSLVLMKASALFQYEEDQKCIELITEKVDNDNDANNNDKNEPINLLQGQLLLMRARCLTRVLRFDLALRDMNIAKRKSRELLSEVTELKNQVLGFRQQTLEKIKEQLEEDPDNEQLQQVLQHVKTQVLDDDLEDDDLEDDYYDDEL